MTELAMQVEDAEFYSREAIRNERAGCHEDAERSVRAAFRCHKRAHELCEGKTAAQNAENLSSKHNYRVAEVAYDAACYVVYPHTVPTRVNGSRVIDPVIQNFILTV